MRFEPNSGGRFDATLSGSTLTIHHELAINSTIQEKSTGEPVDPGIDTNDYVNWRQDFTSVIRAHWKDKYQFTRGGQTVRPEFTQTFCAAGDAAAAQADYVINLVSSDISSNVSPNTHHLFTQLEAQGVWAPKKAQFGVGSNNRTPATHKNIEQSIPNMFPFYIDTNQGSLSTATEKHVLDLAKQVAGFKPGLKIYLTPYGKNAESAKAEVRRVLTAGGLTNVQSRTSKKIFFGHFSTSKGSGRKSYVKLSLSEPLANPSLAHSNLYHYPATVVHEYGHMVGLKDEYVCLSDAAANAMVQCQFIEAWEKSAVLSRNAKTASAGIPTANAEMAEFVRYCKDAGVVPPMFGQQTTSIMSSGSEFHPCHFVTLWAALVDLTNKNDWKIVPHG